MHCCNGSVWRVEHHAEWSSFVCEIIPEAPQPGKRGAAQMLALTVREMVARESVTTHGVRAIVVQSFLNQSRLL